MKRILIFCLSILLFSTSNFAQKKSKIKALDAVLLELEKSNGFNGHIVIAKSDSIIYQKSIGYSDFENKIPITSNTVFELASTGKQFTAMGIMLLKQQAKLNFDDKVSNYIASFPYPDLTIRHLLNMCSGLPDYLEFADSWDLSKIVTNADILEFYKTTKPELTFAPNSQFSYSNTNYVLLAEIIKEVAGQSFEVFLQTEIFDKLNMTSTRSYTTRFSENEVIENYAFPYVKTIDGYVKTNLNPSTQYIIAASGIEGDGTIISTGEDLIKWTNAIKKEILVSRELLKEAYQISILENGKENSYGFGMYIGKNKLWHWGGWPGVQTAYTRYLENDVTVVYFKNVESNNWSWIKELERIVKKM